MWQNFQQNCVINPFSAGDGQRAWFAARDTRPTFRIPDLTCANRLDSVAQYVTAFAQGMGIAGEEARRAGVYPGVLREIRRRYRLDWTGWER